MVRVRSAAAVAGVPVFVATVAIVGSATPGYSQWRDTVSRLGSPGQPHALLARAGLVLYGVLIVFAAAPLRVHAPGRERLLGALVALFGSAWVVAGMAPKCPAGARSNLASDVHVGATVVGGAGIIAAMVLVAATTRRRSERRCAGLVAALSAILVVAFRLSWGTAVYGLVERVLLALAVSWIATLGMRASPGGSGGSPGFSRKGLRRIIRS